MWLLGKVLAKWYNWHEGRHDVLPAQLLLVQEVVRFTEEGIYPYISSLDWLQVLIGLNHLSYQPVVLLLKN